MTTCLGCGTEFHAPPSRRKKYCTVGCYRANAPIGQSQRGPEMRRKCQECATEIVFTTPSLAGSKKFCSRACQGAANGRRMAESAPRVRVTKTCKVCGVEMQVKPSLAERKTTCSRRCNGMQSFASTRPRSSKIGDDSILAWAQHGRFGTDRDWRPEHRVSRWTIDLAFPDLMLAVELDGSYWHSRPEVVAKDAIKDAGLTALGWYVVHIPIEPDWNAGVMGSLIDCVVGRYLHRDELTHIPAEIVRAS